MSETNTAARAHEAPGQESPKPETNKSTEAKSIGAKAEAEIKPAAAAMPAAKYDLAPAPSDASPSGDMDRNAVFSSLVGGDTDITGLVAYSIYKQNKHDWLIAFNRHKAREPREDELYAYIVGESTPRRLATYRHLAEATLEGRGPKVNMGPATEKFVQRSFTNAQNASVSANGGGKLAWLIAAVVAIAAILAAGKFGLPGLR